MRPPKLVNHDDHRESTTMRVVRRAGVLLAALAVASALHVQHTQLRVPALRRACPLCASDLLFREMQAAMTKRANFEYELLAPNLGLLEEPDPTDVPSAVGFGGGVIGRKKKKKGTGAANPLVDQIPLLLHAIKRDGVVKVKGGLRRETALALRECALREIEIAREVVAKDPSKSMLRFNAEVEQPHRGTHLLPFVDEDTLAAGGSGNDSPIVQALRELVGKGSVMGTLIAKHCDGDNSELHDLYALRTEAGSFQQPVRAPPAHKLFARACASHALVRCCAGCFAPPGPAV